MIIDTCFLFDSSSSRSSEYDITTSVTLFKITSPSQVKDATTGFEVSILDKNGNTLALGKSNNGF